MNKSSLANKLFLHIGHLLEIILMKNNLQYATLIELFFFFNQRVNSPQVTTWCEKTV